MNDEGLVKACPHCESSSISRSRERAEKTPDRAWFCGDCRRYFESPDRRQPWNGNSPLTKRLIKMDQDELPRGRS